MILINANILLSYLDRFQWGMLGYVGLIWFADAMELMMLSFIGPAVSGD